MCEPSPEDSVHVALQKIFPERPAEVLDPAARWLNRNFGVMEFADLEGVAMMVDAAKSLVAGDASVSAASKDVLQQLLGTLPDRLAALKQPVTSTSGGSTDCITATPTEPTASAEPRAEESTSRALRKLFPEVALEVSNKACTWLHKNFGVIEYADLVGMKSMADTAGDMASRDADLSSGAKELLQNVFAQLSGQAVQPSDEPRESQLTEDTAQTSCRTDEPCPDDSAAVAMQKLFPKAASEDIDCAAAWLKTNFGVLEFADLDSIRTMIDAAKSLIATDAGLRRGAAELLEALLRKLAGGEGTKHAGEPNPGDAALVALQKMFPEVQLDVLESACMWLSKSFGVREFADLDILKSMADAARSTVKADVSVSSATKRVLNDLIGKLTGSDSQSRKDDFTVMEELGSGTFATAYKVVEKSSKRELALKRMNVTSAADAAVRDQVHNEIKLHKTLLHTNILRCYESFDERGTIYLLLELAECGDLHKLIQKEKTLQESEAARLLAETTAGVHYLHLKGWMHRDLKPENIFLDSCLRAKLGDFGECAETAKKQTKECGSPAYFSPEMCAGLGYDQRIDVWALGILLYEMLSGSWPFPLSLTIVDTKRKILSMEFSFGAWSNVPVLAQPLIKNILRKEPNERPPLLDIMSNSWVVAQAGDCVHKAAEELETKELAAVQATSRIRNELEALKESVDVATLKEVLREAISYGMQDDLVTSLRERYETLKLQTRHREELLKCVYCNSKVDIKKVLASGKAEKLDIPGTWLLPDGPKLYAGAEIWLLELEMRQLGSNYVAAGFTMDICAQAEDDAGLEQGEADLTRVYRDWQVKCILCLAEVPALKTVASEELSRRLAQHCQELAKQIDAHRALQICCVSSSLEEVKRSLKKVKEDGFGSPDRWLLDDGPRLLDLAERRCASLENEQAALDKIPVELGNRTRALCDSMDVAAIDDVICSFEAYNVKSDLLDALRSRRDKLRIQLPMRSALEGCSVSDDVLELKGVIARAREAGLDLPESWLCREWSDLYVAAVSRVEDLERLHSKIEAATVDFDRAGLLVGLDEADRLGISRSQFAAARELFHKLQDGRFVVEKIEELHQCSTSVVNDSRLINLRKLVDEPAAFDTTSVPSVDRSRILELIQRMGMRDIGFSVQLHYRDFLRTYGALFPASDKPSLLLGMQSTSNEEMSKAASRMLENSLHVLVGFEVAASEYLVREATIFIAARLHEALQAALQRRRTGPATKIQSIWRGRYARMAIGVHVKDAMATNRALREKTKLVRTVESAELLEENLESLDALLRQAIRLQLRLPLLDSFLKARADLAAQAKLARLLEDGQTSTSVAEVEGLLARAGAAALEGPVVDALAKRSEHLRTVLDIRQSLKKCVVCNDLDDVERALTKAKDKGLDAHPDCAESCTAASARAVRLREEREKKADALTRITEARDEICRSLDHREIQVHICRLEALSKSEEIVETLTKRCANLKAQRTVLAALEACLTANDVEVVKTALAGAREASLDVPIGWLLPEGPKAFARAQRWQSKLESESQAVKGARSGLERELPVLMCSFDSQSILAFIERARHIGFSEDLVAKLHGRLKTLQIQSPICDSLRRCETGSVLAAKEAALDEGPDGWLFPDGPRYMARAIAWQRWSPQPAHLQALQNMGLDDDDRRQSASSLLRCLDAGSRGEIAAAVAQAKRLGLDSPSSWAADAARIGPDLLAAAQSRLEMLDEQAEITQHAAADLEWQMRVLSSLICPSLKKFRGDALTEALGERCKALRRQLPHLRNLQICLAYDGQKALQKALSGLKTADLQAPAAWLLPEGAALLDEARQRLEQAVT